jgi:photosystem II stability/assembly factor-like uncharacterized protein
MKKLAVFILLFIIYYSLLINHCSAQWYQITLPVSGSVYQMQFINNNTGWVNTQQSGYGYIFTLLKTTNAGVNWQPIFSDSSKVKDFQFLNDSIGYAHGHWFTQELLLKTTNSGYNWNILQNVDYVFNGFYMLNTDTGWVNAFIFNPPNPSSYIFRTNNGFQTMELISTGAGGTPAKMNFFQKKYNGEYCGYMSSSGYLWKTTNSGYNWIQINPSGTLYGYSFINKDTGWVNLDYQFSKIYKSTNGGQNWNLQFNYSTNNTIYSVFAINENKIWSGTGQNYILASINGGLTWGTQSSPLYSNGSIYMYDTLLGFAWTSSLIVRSTNGGGPILTVEKISRSIPTTIDLKQNYPNPFNPTTTIEFEIPKSTVVNIELYDLLGRKVYTIIDSKEFNSGIYKVNIDFNNLNLPGGIYFYLLFADGIRVDTRKLVLLK